jgi:outer membrane protein assembly factor BamB
VLAGDVLLIGVSSGDVLLTALDPATGATRWNYTPAK